ncbi:hypothetical protein [Actinoplanes sp. NPDC049802]|uniref:hypothetical protein n=1 Tax=Actinoplanes sp. NPDC049802 TaxID=3154742 RepID=UPI0033F18CE7
MSYLRRLFSHATVFDKPGFGILHFLRPWWRPNTVSEVWYQPEGIDTLHRVPLGAMDDMLEAGSHEQAMAIIRAAQTNSAP